MQKLISSIATHRNPHLDEAAALALLLEYRPAVLAPQIDFVFLSAGRLNGTDAGQHDADTLCLGILGSLDDEHVPGRENECCATLIAKRFGLFDPMLGVQIALAPILRMDRSGPHADEIAATMKHVARYSGLNDRAVFDWGVVAARALLREGQEMAAAFKASLPSEPGRESERVKTPKVSVKTETVGFYVHKHFPEAAKDWFAALELANTGREKERAEAVDVVKKATVRSLGGRKLVIIETDNREAANISRETHCHDLVLVFRSTGLAQILTSGSSASGFQKLNLVPLLVELRRREMVKRDLKPLSPEEEVLANTPMTCQWWFGHSVDNGQRIGSVFNGTQDAAIEVEPTKLSRLSIQEAVQTFLLNLAPAASQPPSRQWQRHDRQPHRRHSAPQGRRHHDHHQHAGHGGSGAGGGSDASPMVPFVSLEAAFAAK